LHVIKLDISFLLDNLYNNLYVVSSFNVVVVMGVLFNVF